MEIKPGKEKILIVDDSVSTLEVIKRNLSMKGYQVFSSTNVSEAIKILESAKIDLVITDLKMPKISGLDLIRYVKDNFKNSEIIMITGYPTIEGAIKAVKIGAEDYLSKPFTDEELFSAVSRALEKLHQKRSSLKGVLAPASFHGIIGDSKPMHDVFNMIEKAASTSYTVLITGESGTGKELVARGIHYHSSRNSAPFIPVNCSAIPETLLESELFGYIKGAFTGANESRAGFFQTAEGGTIFLDEIGDTALAMQAKLLRILQNKEVSMVGDSKPRKVDVRVITATNKDLSKLVGRQIFREDLYYRLNVLHIEVPPLREREDDIFILTSHFLEKYSAELGKEKQRFSDRALDVLKNYSWPGNIRELENLVQRLCLMVEQNIIDVPDLPDYMRFDICIDSSGLRTLEEVQNRHIIYVLESVNNNQSQAAKILGINRKTLREKLKKMKP